MLGQCRRRSGSKDWREEPDGEDHLGRADGKAGQPIHALQRSPPQATEDRKGRRAADGLSDGEREEQEAKYQQGPQEPVERRERGRDSGQHRDGGNCAKARSDESECLYDRALPEAAQRADRDQQKQQHVERFEAHNPIVPSSPSLPARTSRLRARSSLPAAN